MRFRHNLVGVHKLLVRIALGIQGGGFAKYVFIQNSNHYNEMIWSSLIHYCTTDF